MARSLKKVVVLVSVVVLHLLCKVKVIMATNTMAVLVLAVDVVVLV